MKADKDGIVIGPVYQPLRLDSQNEATIREEIKKQAYNFMLNGRWDAIDIEHDKKKSGCRVVESFIVRDGDPEYTPGDWVLAAKVFDEDLLERVEKGELNAWSFSGKVTRTPVLFLLSHPIEGEGTTEKSDGGIVGVTHSHTVKLVFDDNARVVPTWTDINLGHSHIVPSLTATALEFDHAHRLKIVED